MMELQIGGEAVEQYALGRSDQLKGECASLLRNQSMRSFRSLSLLFFDGLAMCTARHRQDGELGDGLRAPWGRALAGHVCEP